MGLAVYTSRLFVSWVVLTGLVMLGAGAPADVYAAPAQGKRVEKPASPAKKSAGRKPVAKQTASKKAGAKKVAAKKPAAKSAAATAASAKGSASSSKAVTTAKASKPAVKSAPRGGERGKAVARTAKAGRGGSKRVARASRRGSARRPAVVKSRRPMPPLPEGVAHDALLSFATSHIGTPYRFGGASAAGMDCSGFTRTVFSEIGLSLPHSAQGQFTMGERIAKYELQPGDLVFFRTYRRGASHVGIYLGDDLFIHAASRGGIVRVDALEDSYYRARYLGARRLRPTEI